MLKNLTDGYLSDRSTSHREPDVSIKLQKAYYHHLHQKHQNHHNHQLHDRLCLENPPELMVSQVSPYTDIRAEPIAILLTS